MKKIGIVGSGEVARTLGNGFLKYGYSVMLGSRDPLKLKEWKEKGGHNAITGSFKDTAGFSELLLLAVKGDAAEAVLKSIGLENLKGKTIIDSCNPIDPTRPPVNGVLNFFTKLDDSLMERLQKLVPEAKFVKAFSCAGNRLMVNPEFKGGKPTMFICGNDKKAKSEITSILDQFGWETEDLGMVEGARAIEPLCIL
jgi:8-hydroxy-5-deazaflavin:NADPH oxidoreductase